MNYVIERPSIAETSYSQPTHGLWYAGITENNETGAVAQFLGTEFRNSVGSVDMTRYPFIRETMGLVPESSEDDDKSKVRLALRWLETLSKNRCLMWAPEQKEACLRALEEAKATL